MFRYAIAQLTCAINESDGSYQFITTASHKVDEPEILGCGILNAMQRHYNPQCAQAACSPSDPDFNFLDTILTHREAFVAWPYGHRTCSKALTQLAFELERRHHCRTRREYCLRVDALQTAAYRRFCPLCPPSLVTTSPFSRSATFLFDVCRHY